MTNSELKTLIKECVQEVAIEEGLMDRLKSRAAGVGDFAKNAVKAGANTVASKLSTTDDLKKGHEKQATADMKNAKDGYGTSKVAKYRQIAEKNFDKTVDEIIVDLNKLGVFTDRDKNGKYTNNLKAGLRKMLAAWFDRLPKAK